MFKVNYITQDLSFYQNAEVNGNGWPVMNLLRGVGEGTTTQFVIKKKEPLRVELENFISRVQGSQVSLVNGRDARSPGNGIRLYGVSFQSSSKNAEVTYEYQ